jgi:hypothetical protein
VEETETEDDFTNDHEPNVSKEVILISREQPTLNLVSD